MSDLPLHEFDPSPGVITPSSLALTERLPERVVLCYFPEIVAALSTTHGGRQIGRFSLETGRGDIFVVGSSTGGTLNSTAGAAIAGLDEGLVAGMMWSCTLGRTE